MGKPVVSTPMAALEAEPIADSATFVAGSAASATAVRGCLDHDSPEKNNARTRAIAPYSRDLLFARLDKTCSEAIS